MPYANIGDIKLYYRIYASGHEKSEINKNLPTLIVLHGGPGFVDHSLYIPFWSHLSMFMQVVFPDQRGNGRSDHGSQKKWNLTECGKDIYLFCEALGIKKPIVAGVSWGGYVAMSYVSQYPDHSKALIFCNTEAKVSTEARRKQFIKLGGKAAGDAVWEYDHHPEKEGVHENFIKFCLPYYAKHKPYTPDELAKCKTNYAMRKKFMLEENLKFDFRNKLGKVVCPVLILAGEDDAAHPLECAYETASSIPDEYVKLVVLKDAGAPLYNDKPGAVFAIILKFITEVCIRVAREMPSTRK